jgi:CheY-like chemotaxis protein
LLRTPPTYLFFTGFPREITAITSSTSDEDLKEMKLSGLKEVIRKPYRRVNLSQIVHEALKVTN